MKFAAIFLKVLIVKLYRVDSEQTVEILKFRKGASYQTSAKLVMEQWCLVLIVSKYYLSQE